MGCVVPVGCSLGWFGYLCPGYGLFSFVILGCLCPRCGRGLVWFVSPLPGVWAWFSLVGFPVGPVCGVWFDVGGLLCSGCCLLLLLGRKAFAIFPVFPGFGGACPAGLGC